MFTRKKTTASTEDYLAQINKLKKELENADAVIIGAGAGMSTAAGFTYDGERFYAHFSDFHQKYGITDMYSGGFYPYDSLEEYWAWWSRQIFINRYETHIGQPYAELLELTGNKDYFVLTTNVDHQFQLAGFDKERLFYTQGDYGLFQCGKACHDQTYDNEEIVRQMIAQQKDMKIPTELIPKCPVCGAPMVMNLRCDSLFVQDAGWHAAAERYQQFTHRHKNGRVLFLELGVGGNTPGIIKYPFWKMTEENPYAVYACINKGEAFCPRNILKRSICIDENIGAVISDMKNNSSV